MEDLRTKLQAAHEQIAAARKALPEAKEHTIIAKEQLNSSETAILIMGNLKGKNKEERDADMTARTSDDHAELLRAGQSEREATLTLELALDCRRHWENMMNLEMMGDA